MTKEAKPSATKQSADAAKHKNDEFHTPDGTHTIEDYERIWGTTETTYRGYKLSSDAHHPFVTIEGLDKKEVPTKLKGSWTSKDDARRAIDLFLDTDKEGDKT